MKLLKLQYFCHQHLFLGWYRCCWELTLTPIGGQSKPQAWLVTRTHENGDTSCCVPGNVSSGEEVASQQKGTESWG